MRHPPSDPSRPHAHRPHDPFAADEEPEEILPAVPAPPSRHRPARSRTPLETVLLASTAALLAAVAWPIAFGEAPSSPPAPASPNAPTPALQAIDTVQPSSPAPSASGIDVVQGPSIQIALLLDTSSSMDGLIDQARSQLWSVVNALDSATLHGEQPTIEIALYEYGNSKLHFDQGFIRQVSPFTAELDLVSEKLFELQTNGGSEHTGQAIARSIDELEWRGEGLRVVYIAGNEEFDQGPVPWAQAIERARGQGIVVNTVNCTQGTPDRGWREAASASGGRFLQIDHNATVQHIDAPQDAQLARLGEQLNETYVGYGAKGSRGLRNQVAQDSNASSFGSASTVQRAITKSSRNYVNPSWDLLDGIGTKTTTVDQVDRSSLPEELREMSDQQLDRWVEDKTKERADLKAKMAELARERAQFVAAKRSEQQEGPERLDTAIVRSILEQARDAGFTIEPTP